MAIEKCGCCNGVGKVYIHRPTTGPDGIENCFNCHGNGYVITTANLFVRFKRNDELPLTKWVGRGTAHE